MSLAPSVLVTALATLSLGAQTPTLLADLVPGPNSSGAGGYIELGDVTVFRTAEYPIGRLWRTDGTTAGTQQLGSFNYQFRMSGPYALGDRAVLFVEITQNGPWELWSTDGTVAGTGSLGRISNFTAFGGWDVVAGERLFFEGWTAAGKGLWTSDGTVAGTMLLAASSSSGTGLLTKPLGNRAVFRLVTTTHGLEPWISDGTPAGTTILHDITPGTTSGSASRLWCDGQSLYIWGQGGPGQMGVWRSDGIPGGPLQFLLPTTQPDALVGVADGFLYTFDANNLIATELATMTSAPIGFWFERPSAFFELENATVGVRSAAVYVMNGLQAMTALPSFSTNNSNFLQAGSRRLFYTTGQSGIAQTDGTPAGTSLVTTISAGGLAVCHGKLYFTGCNNTVGCEPFVMDLGATSSRLGTGIGEGARVPNLTVTDPVIGSTATVELRNGVSRALLALLMTLGPPQPTLLAPNGWLYVGAIQPAPLFQVMSGDSWQRGYPVPNVAALAGLDIPVQAALLGTGSPAPFELSNAVHAVVGN